MHGEIRASGFWYQEYEKKARSSSDLIASGRGDRFGVADYLKVIGHVASSLALTPGDRLLDVGCGNGLMAIVLSELCRELVGIEPVEALAAQARAHNRARSGVRIVVGESWALPITSRSVDRLLCYGVLQLLEDLDAVERSLAEMARVLRPGGRGLIGAIPDLRVRDRVLGPYLESVRTASHLSAEEKAAIIERNRRGQWFDPPALARLAEGQGLVVTTRGAPAHLLEAEDRFELLVERR